MAHPDFLLGGLTAGQWLDWVRYSRQFNVSIGREDLMQACARRDFIAVHTPEDEFPPRLCEVSPYIPDPLDADQDDEEIEALRQRLSRPMFGGKVVPGA